MSSVGVVFADGFVPDQVKLLQVDAALLQRLESGTDQLRLCGTGAGSGAVLVSATQSFDVVKCETSNALLVLEPHDGGGDEQQQQQQQQVLRVSTSCQCHYELVPRAPHLAALRAVLRRFPLGAHELAADAAAADDDDDDRYQPTDEVLRCCAFENLQNVAQCSAAQLGEALRRLRAIHFKGCWRILQDALANRVFVEFLELLDEQGWEFTSISSVAVTLHLEEYPVDVVRLVLASVSTDDQPTAASFSVEGDEVPDLVYALDEAKVCQKVAVLILSKHQGMPHQEFLSEWTSVCPTMMNPDVQMLRGIAIQADSVAKNWTHLPIDELPDDQKQRFVKLFEVQSKWRREDLLAFLPDLIEEGHAADKMLLKFTRSFKQKEGDAEVTYYTPRLNIRK